MQRGLVGSEMCIRDRYQRRVHGMEKDKVREEEEIVIVDGKKMKKIKRFEARVVREFTPKGVLRRQGLKPFGLGDHVEGSRIDKNPCFFEVHGKGKQIKVKVDTLPRINQEMKELDQAIEGEKIRMKELDENGMELDFTGGQFRGDRDVNEDAVLRVSNIPDIMTNMEMRKLFSKYGRIMMMTMPKPIPISEEQKRNQRRFEKRNQKREKKMKQMGLLEEKKEEEKAPLITSVRTEEEKNHRGFAYVYFYEPEAAAHAIAELHDKPFYSQVISVKKARPRRRG
eukprot:TRINITY_DN34479_c0_g1_i1.p1 TRINITY_DN34479_c0_g1~~TRINITY_DN34479_c0_g1_i1.p1  ORF type:complete len:283 (-),score=87.25 TRINITY_DN34479_c0_g1_i1:169-1017(-)